MRFINLNYRFNLNFFKKIKYIMNEYESLLLFLVAPNALPTYSCK